MKILGRNLGNVLRAGVDLRTYTSLARIFTRFGRPARFARLYLLGGGSFPSEYTVRTPIGPRTITAYHREDILTANEIFARLDYTVPDSARVCVDLGGNIGLAALYFLTRAPDTVVYSFEPVPTNVVRLRSNLAGLESRCTVAEQAVAVRPGVVEFGIEPTGRLGSLAAAAREGSVSSRDYRSYIQVQAVSIVDVLNDVLARHGRIDVLKIDVEGTEAELLAAIPDALRARIGCIHAEWTFTSNPLASTHSYRQRGSVATFLRRASAEPAPVDMPAMAEV